MALLGLRPGDMARLDRLGQRARVGEGAPHDLDLVPQRAELVRVANEGAHLVSEVEGAPGEDLAERTGGSGDGELPDVLGLGSLPAPREARAEGDVREACATSAP